MEKSEFEEVLGSFTRNLDSLNDVSPIIGLTLKTFLSRGSEEFNKHLEDCGEEIDNPEEEKSYKVPIHQRVKTEKLSRMLARFELANALIPKSFLVSYVSEFDSFLGNLLKVIYRRKPELLNGSERQLTFSELQDFKSIEDAREHILEKEVETLLRKSHAEHFNVLEKKFEMPLKKGLDIWSSYIELTERRNLFVHCDGVVSSQYLSVCQQHSVDTKGLSTGQKLTVDSDYLKSAYSIIYELAVKLTHVLWRKQFPEDRETADRSYNDLCFELILHQEYHLASKLLEFAVNDFKKYHNETYKRMFVINLAQAYKYSSEDKKCATLIKRFDWNASGYEFKLAIAVLREEFEDALEYMQKAVATEDIGEVEFIEWPLFKEFRKDPRFISKFEDLFGKPFPLAEDIPVEEPEQELSSGAADEMKKDLLEDLEEK
ncbi:TPA: hypothetical protein N2935_004513 [Vibrio parahaemolyticus]|uniref:hypothetical protein n=1 Tax=Vibrio alginolyticus TaxID=663 RepID=UPI0001BE07A4|nr:hypothetical protein [Vibrio alginolyticus]EEZ81779.1 hypothetical protein VMC_33590 [Vibrio alginolyticus 40B]HCG7246832.1 hypothetical protein [Vibrio parahaemolyticus]EKP4442219.1 hypothetical protein [Vibrio alginolyticus]ELB2839916.1 hypothetical protein [Vibrio alginolyticus]MBS9926224.1 hypothetical protein [Vibrio alginolyticus]